MDDQLLDHEIAELLGGDVPTVPRGFVDALRAELAAELDGRPRVIFVATEAAHRRGRSLPWILTAAAALSGRHRRDRRHT